MDNTSECFGFDVHNVTDTVMNEWNCLGCLKYCLSSQGGGEQLEGNLFRNKSHVGEREETDTYPEI